MTSVANRIQFLYVGIAYIRQSPSGCQKLHNQKGTLGVVSLGDFFIENRKKWRRRGLQKAPLIGLL